MVRIYNIQLECKELFPEAMVKRYSKILKKGILFFKRMVFKE